MLTRFELEYTRRHHTERIGDKGSMENCGSRGGSNHTFTQHTAPYNKLFIPGLDGYNSYRIKYFNFDK